MRCICRKIYNYKNYDRKKINTIFFFNFWAKTVSTLLVFSSTVITFEAIVPNVTIPILIAELFLRKGYYRVT